MAERRFYALQGADTPLPGVQPGPEFIANIPTEAASIIGYYVPNSALPEETYYPLPPSLLAQFSGTLGAINVIQFVPFVLAASITIDRLAFAVAGASGAGGLARAGIYLGNTTTVKPTTLLVAGAEQTVDTTGLKSATVNLSLSAGGLYFFAYIAGVAAATGHVLSQTGSVWSVTPFIGVRFNAFPPTNNWRFGWTLAQAYGALPADVSAGSFASAALSPIGYVRVLSTP